MFYGILSYFRRLEMFAVRFLPIYTTLCHSVLQVFRCGRQHECVYLTLERPEFKLANEAPYNGPHLSAIVDMLTDTIFIKAVRMQCVGTSSCHLRCSLNCHFLSSFRVAKSLEDS